MTPRLVIICSFIFACTIVVGGGILFGGKRHAPAPRQDVVSEGLPAKSPQPEPSQAEPSQPNPSQSKPTQPESQQAVSQPSNSPQPEPPQPDSSKSAPSKPEPSKPDNAQQDPKPPEPPRQEATQPDSTAQETLQPLPVIISYELKRERDAKWIIARDPKGFWIRQIVAKIEDQKTELPNPPEQPTAVQLEFVVKRDGTLVSKTVSKSSGSDEADKTAIAMLEHAQPFPPMPERMLDEELTFSLPVSFR